MHVQHVVMTGCEITRCQSETGAKRWGLCTKDCMAPLKQRCGSRGPSLTTPGRPSLTSPGILTFRSEIQKPCFAQVYPKVGGGGNCSYEYTIGTRAGNSMVPTLIPYGDEPQHHEVLLLSVATLPLAMSHMWIAVDICFHRLSVNLQSASYVVFALLARSALRWTRMHKHGEPWH